MRNEHDQAHALLSVIGAVEKLTPLHVSTIRARIGHGGGVSPLGASKSTRPLSRTNWENSTSTMWATIPVESTIRTSPKECFHVSIPRIWSHIEGKNAPESQANKFNRIVRTIPARAMENSAEMGFK